MPRNLSFKIRKKVKLTALLSASRLFYKKFNKFSGGKSRAQHGILWGGKYSVDNTGNPIHDKCATLSWLSVKRSALSASRFPFRNFPLCYEPAGNEISSMAARDLAKKRTAKCQRENLWRPTLTLVRAKQIACAGVALPGFTGVPVFPSTCRHNFGILMRNPYLCCLFCKKKKRKKGSSKRTAYAAKSEITSGGGSVQRHFSNQF